LTWLADTRAVAQEGGSLPLCERPARDSRHRDGVTAAHGELRARLPVLPAHEAERGERAGAEGARDRGEVPDVLAVAHQRRATRGGGPGEKARPRAPVAVPAPRPPPPPPLPEVAPLRDADRVLDRALERQGLLPHVEPDARPPDLDPPALE